MDFNDSKILHIDDDEANRYAVKMILEKAGFLVESAEDGAHGMELMAHRPDLVILDIKLPDISGFELCKQFKSNPKYKQIPVLQTSATFTTSDHKVEGLDSGADGYLAQPIESAVLVATVRSLLRIRRAEKIAKEAIRSREDMMAIVSHDLRNPLSFIMLQMKLLERHLKSDDMDMEKILTKLNAVTNSCHRMNRLIQDLLDVASIEEGKFSIINTVFKASDLINDAHAMFEDQARSTGIRLMKNFEGPDLTIKGDRERLLQLLSNLISNSLKFTPRNGKIEISMISKGDKALFSVQDSGQGIAAEELPHVFNRFWQGHLEKKGGFGLGLSIVKGIVEAHQGSVGIESEQGKGTLVHFTIPATN